MSAVERQLLSSIEAALPDGFASVVILSQGASTLSFDSLLAEKKGTKISSVASLEELPAASDVIVSDGFLSAQGVLEDADGLESYAKAVLRSLRHGGALLLREDLAAHADSARHLLPSLTAFFDVYRVAEDGDTAHVLGFEFYAADQIEGSIHLHQNWLDFVWILRKQKFEKPSGENVTFRDFLDKTQYTNTGIGAYEWMFGENFISPGGYDENLKVLSYLGPLEAGRTMLDIGSGIGGGVRQVASVFGVHVTGIDLSSNMLSEAIVRLHREKDSRVKYTICDATTYRFPPASFDYVFSRDCIQHIEDTELLFRQIYNSLRPGGVVVISMYGHGAGEFTDKFKEYVKNRYYFLKSNAVIAETAKKVGFTEVYTENLTPRFKDILVEEKAKLEKEKADFLSKFTEKEFASLVNGWEDKLGYIEADNHNWNIFRARRPLSQ